MKRQLKKGIALLTAGILLTTSAAAYAAQLPGETTAGFSIPSSSQQEIGLNVTLKSYELTTDKISMGFGVRPVGDGGLQLRISQWDVLVEQENAQPDGAVTLWEVQNDYSEPYGYGFTIPVSLPKGARIHVRATARATVFLGYTPVGNPSTTVDYYFTV